MVQLENELDFFDCEDRAGLSDRPARPGRQPRHHRAVDRLRRTGRHRRSHRRRTGHRCCLQLLPDDDSPHIEAEVRRYAALLAERDLPLLVTETNRRHRTLRRLLASGASLIAPYLQSSGWNFGYTPSTGNWGDPGNFMSHDYDFGGYVSPTGAESDRSTPKRRCWRE